MIGYSPVLLTNINNTCSFFIAQHQKQIVTVAAKGADFTSVAVAVDYIIAQGDAGPAYPYQISIGPGLYVEPVIDLTSAGFVTIQGADIQSTIIRPDGPHDIIVSGNTTNVNFLQFDGAPITNTSYAAIRYVDVPGSGLLCHKVQFNNCNGIYQETNTISTYTYTEICDFNGTFNYAIKVVCNNPALIAQSFQDVFYVLPTDPVIPAIGAMITGIGANFNITSGAYIGNLPIATGDTGLQVENGAQLNSASFQITYADNAILNNSSPTPCLLTILGCFLDNNNIDLQLIDPNLAGTFEGTATFAKCVGLNEVPNFSWNFTDIATGALEITNTMNVTFPAGTHTEILELVENQGIGLISGGVITQIGAMTVSVSDIVGYYVNTNNELAKAIINGIPPITFTLFNTVYYIYVDTNGNLTYGLALTGPGITIPIGRVYISSAIEFIDNLPTPVNNIAANYGAIALDIFGPLYVSGSIVTVNVPQPLGVDVTNGQFYSGSIQFNPVGQVFQPFDAYYRSVTIGQWDIELGQTTINSAFYDDGSGTLANIPLGQWVKAAFYVIDNGEKYFFVFPQQYFPDQNSAVVGPLPTPPSFFTGGIVIIAAFIYTASASAITQILSERPFPTTQASATAAVSNHLLLTHLTDGNAGHTQFLMLDGSTPMAGNITMGTNAAPNYSITASSSYIGTLQFDGVTVANHHARHRPGGADALPVGVPITIATSNLQGSASTFALSDHQHDHGAQTDTTLHAIATDSANGFMSAADKTKLDNLPTATSANTPNTLVLRDGSGNFAAGTITANLNGNAATVTTNANLTGPITSVGNATSIGAGVIVPSNIQNPYGTALSNLSGVNTGDQMIVLTGGATGSGGSGNVTNVSVTLTNASVTGQVLTGFVSMTGIVSATDSILTALEKLYGNSGGFQPTGNYITSLYGDGVATGPVGGGAANLTLSTVNASPGTYGTVGFVPSLTVNGKGLVTAASNIIAITNLNTASTVVSRDASGNFSAGTITASLTGNATNVTGIVALANGGTGSNYASKQAAFIGLSNMTTLGQMNYYNTAAAIGVLAGNITTTKKYLSQTGTGALSAAPSWAQIAIGDLTAGTTGQIPISNGTVAAWTTMSGDATLNSAGALSLATTGVSANTYGGTGFVPQFSVNAKGLLTAASNAITITNANTASTVVSRDASGNFSAGTITASLTGAATQLSLIAASQNFNMYVTFSVGATGAQSLYTDPGIEYNPSTQTLYTNISGTVTNAQKILLTASSGQSMPMYIPFANPATGNQSLITDANIYYTPSTTTFYSAISQSGNGSAAAPAVIGADTTSGLYFSPANVSVSIASARTTAFNTANTTSYVNVLPNVTNTLNIGSNALQWNNVYAQTYNGALNGNASTATLATESNTIYTNVFSSSNIPLYLTFAESATNSYQSLYVYSFLTYNSTTNILNATISNINITNTSTSATYYIPFVSSSASGSQTLDVYSSISCNPNTSTITATTFAGTASYAAGAALTAATTGYLMFASGTSGNVTYNSAANLNFNSAVAGGTLSTGTLSVTTVNATLINGTTFTGNAATATTSTNLSVLAGVGSTTYYPSFAPNSSAGAQQLSVSSLISFTTNAGNTAGTLITNTFMGSLSGNATTATTATNANNINLIAAPANATYYPALATTNTAGNQALDVSGLLSFAINAGGSAGTLTCATFVGALTGNAASASTLNISSASGVGPYYISFTSAASGNQPQYVNTNFAYNASSNILTVPSINSNISVTNLAISNTNYVIPLITSSATGYYPLNTSGAISYNPNTQVLTAIASNANQILMNTPINGTPYYIALSGSVNVSQSNLYNQSGFVWIPGSNILELIGDAMTIQTTGAHNLILGSNSTPIVYVNTTGLMPNTTNTYSLGTAGLVYSNVYATTFTGSLSGNAASATYATNGTIAATSANSTFYPMFASNTSGNLPFNVNSGLSYNPSTATLTTTTVTAALNGNAASATYASTGTIVAISANSTYYPIFASATAGNLAFNVNSSLNYNPNSVTLTCTNFIGSLSGNATTATTANIATNITTTTAITGVNYYPIMSTSSTGLTSTQSYVNSEFYVIVE